MQHLGSLQELLVGYIAAGAEVGRFHLLLGAPRAPQARSIPAVPQMAPQLALSTVAAPGEALSQPREQ